jgi:hypothetical protein
LKSGIYATVLVRRADRQRKIDDVTSPPSTRSRIPPIAGTAGRAGVETVVRTTSQIVKAVALAAFKSSGMAITTFQIISRCQRGLGGHRRRRRGAGAPRVRADSHIEQLPAIPPTYRSVLRKISKSDGDPAPQRSADAA